MLTDNTKILFIAPLPPPVTGNSLAVKILLDEMSKTHQANVVNLSKDSFKNGVNSLDRVLQIFKILNEVRKKKKGAGLIYFTIAESIAGNLKDLLIYLLCYAQLSKMIIHLHGGAGMRIIMMNKKSLLYKINKFFLKRLGGVIVLGKSHLDIYADFIPPEKLHIVPNFAEDYLFPAEQQIEAKFATLQPINILFLSNLIEGKGHLELVDAYATLDNGYKEKIRINFAGGFESDLKKMAFLEKIKAHENLQYLGIVSGNDKKEAFAKAHVFTLPTYYPYEGQPISILEAYATGCFVVTTDHSGIFDVFEDGKNGKAVEKRSIPSLRSALQYIADNPHKLLPVALENHRTAKAKYRTNNYNPELMKIFNKIINNRIAF